MFRDFRNILKLFRQKYLAANSHCPFQHPEFLLCAQRQGQYFRIGRRFATEKIRIRLARRFLGQAPELIEDSYKSQESRRPAPSRPIRSLSLGPMKEDLKAVAKAIEAARLRLVELK